jgi:sec-independent protein translocase protein TatA
MGNIGTGELIIALLVVVMLFGARRLPEVARGLGQFLKIFKSEPL